MSAPNPFAPGNAAAIADLKAVCRPGRLSLVALAAQAVVEAPAFRPVDTGGLNWAGALQELRKPTPIVLTKFTFLVELKGGERRIVTWSGTDQKDALQLAWQGLAGADQLRCKRITPITNGAAA